MEVSIYARNMDLTPRLQDYVQRKIGRLDRYLPWIDDVRVDLKVENTRSADHRQVAQLTIRMRDSILRAEERTSDMFASIDAVLDKMFRQIARYKGKRHDRWQAGLEELPVTEPSGEEVAGEIVRTKRFDLRPMAAEEAIEQMELLGHDFFAFYDTTSNAFCVVYKRRYGGYGLLQPELS